jgi:methionyl-tRNA formyltransferase
MKTTRAFAGNPDPSLKQPSYSDASTSRPPLRIGLLIDSFVQRQWIYRIIEEINASGIAQIVAVIKNEAQTPPQSRLKSYWRNRKYLLYTLYEKIDARRVRNNPDAFAPSDIRPLLSDTPVIEVVPEMKAYSDWFPAEKIDEIREFDLDVALSFGFRILKGDVLKIARHGIWSYHHGDNLVNRGGPAGFWEVMDGIPVTGSVLQVLSEDLDNGPVIYRSWSPTSDRFSVKANRNNLYWKSSAFVLRKLKDLAAGAPFNTSENELYRPYSHRLFRMPTNSEMLPRLGRLTRKYAASKLDSVLYHDQWALAYRFRTGPGDANNTFYRFKNLTPPKDRFWADPCAVQAGDAYFVFIEEYLNSTGKGHISVIELDRKKGFVNGPITVLERDYHLSYPCVFEWRDSYYMVPESAANKTVELYRSTSFPFKWELEKVLLTDVRAKDATLVEIDGTWWMFVSIAEHSIPDELYLYFADSPLGPWTPHQRNPVKSDVRGSRPAGKLFEWNGDVYRPAQNSSGRYGYGMSINRVTQLDREVFREEEVSQVLPNWRKDLLGTHTISIAGDLTVIDCLVKRPRWS